ncbi:MAG: hypothetical protein IIA70_09055, partial [Proteobacteria bacterium]|nr:hypothetical protein [Pseudomonadota bacterium]
HSESSYRFERTIDKRRIEETSLRASQLFVKIAHAVPASQEVVAGEAKAPKGTWIKLRLSRLNAVLGTSIPRDRVIKILASLGFKIKADSRTEIRVKSLLQRTDVGREEDLIEEVGGGEDQEG